MTGRLTAITPLSCQAAAILGGYGLPAAAQTVAMQKGLPIGEGSWKSAPPMRLIQPAKPRTTTR